MQIVIFGKPGSGKGTQAHLLAQRKSYLHISTGDLLRNAIQTDAGLGRRVQQVIQTGGLVSDNIIFSLLRKSWCSDKNVIFDGFPRRIEQAKMLDDFLKNHNTRVDYVIVLDLDDSVIITRILERAQKTGQERADDNEESIKKRLHVYQNETEPVQLYYQKMGIVYHVDALQTIDDVFANIERIIDK